MSRGLTGTRIDPGFKGNICFRIGGVDAKYRVNLLVSSHLVGSSSYFGKS